MAAAILPAPPLRDVLDDEEMLARADVAEQPRLGGDRRRRPGVAELPPEHRVLTFELRDLGDPGRPLRARGTVVVERPVVEERDEEKDGERERAAPSQQSGHSLGTSRAV